MDSSTQAITPLRQRMIDDMRMRKLRAQDAGRTTSAPCSEFAALPRALARHRHASRICGATSCTWSISGTSPISLNAAITGLKFFFEITLDQRRADGQDAAGARAAHAAGGTEPRRSGAPDRGGRAT